MMLGANKLLANQGMRLALECTAQRIANKKWRPHRDSPPQSGQQPSIFTQYVLLTVQGQN